MFDTFHNYILQSSVRDWRHNWQKLIKYAEHTRKNTIDRMVMILNFLKHVFIPVYNKQKNYLTLMKEEVVINF